MKLFILLKEQSKYLLRKVFIFLLLLFDINYLKHKLINYLSANRLDFMEISNNLYSYLVKADILSTEAARLSPNTVRLPSSSSISL